MRRLHTVGSNYRRFGERQNYSEGKKIMVAWVWRGGGERDEH